MLTYVLFIIGFFILIKGADLLIEGASSVAKRLKVSDLVIGLTIVAFGTSAPELIVNVISSYTGNAELAISNILGSNIANTFLALGIAAFITPLSVKRNTVLKEIPLAFLAALTLGLLANDALINMEVASTLSRIDGLILACFFTIFLFYTITVAKAEREKPDERAKVIPIGRSIVLIIFGMLGLMFGGDWIVTGAIEIATNFGLSQAFIGLTIVAIGTSLPEIVTCAVSAYKGNSDIAIGNAVGSNIFNIFWVLALSSIVKPLPFDTKINFDVVTNIVAAALLFLFLYVANKKHTLKKSHGIIFIVLYVAYIGYLIYRG